MSSISPNAPIDWLRALHTLVPEDTEARTAIATALGMQIRDTGKLREEKAPHKAKPPVDTRPSAQEPPAEAPEPAGSQREAVPSELNAVDLLPHAPPDWLRTVPHLADVDPDAFLAPLPYEPLFRPQWTRAIVGGSLSTPGPTGDVDLDLVISRIAQARPVETVPRLAAPTLARGVQVLLDVGEGMQPFAIDQAAARATIVRVVGRDKTRILSFAGCPHWGAGSGLPDEWTAYVPPALGTPVLLLTDLGVGRPRGGVDRPTVEDWLAFVATMRRAGCPVVAFVPYPSQRWPQELRRHMTIVAWDRTTTVAAVRRLVGSGLRSTGASA